MEVQMCYAIQNPNSDYDYETIGMCLLIIYSTALSVVLILKQPIEIIKEAEIIKEMEEEEVVKEEVQTQVTKEEEEVIEKEVVKVDVQTQVTKEEDEEVIEKEEEKTKKEEELLLANYNAKERALALQTAYEEQFQALIKKRIKIYNNIEYYYTSGRLTIELPHKMTSNQCLSSIIQEQVLESFTRDIKKLDKEIIIMAKKAGLFGENSDLLKEIEKLPDSTFVAEYKYIVSIM